VYVLPVVVSKGKTQSSAAYKVQILASAYVRHEPYAVFSISAITAVASSGRCSLFYIPFAV
jgi:hypothetical protein